MDRVEPASPQHESATAIQRVSLVPVALPIETAQRLASLLSRRVAVPCEVSPRAGVEPPPRLGTRAQHDADALLRGLGALAIPTRTVVVGVTALDLAIPVFTHVFGRAMLGGPAALISLARLGPEFYGAPPNPTLTLERGVTEILHELGHVAGLDHCADRGCIMSFVPNVESLDLRGRGFCVRCAERTAARVPLAHAPGAP